METSFKGPLIVEFNGLPGSGKTTLANMLKSKFEALGLPVHTRYYRYPLPKRRYLPLIMPRYYGLLFDINRLSKTLSSKKELYIKLSFINYIQMYRDFITDKKDEIMIVDQGLIQSLISLAYDDIINNVHPLKHLLYDSKLFDLPILFVNCYLEPEESHNRIKTRPLKKGGFRLEYVDDNKILDILRTQENNFNIIRKEIESNASNSYIDIDMKATIDINIDKLLNYCTNYITFNNGFNN